MFYGKSSVLVSSSAHVNLTVIYRFDIRDFWWYTSAHGKVGEHLLIETGIKRVPSRFFGIREFLYFNRGIRDFKGKSGRDSGLKVSRMVGCKKIIGIAGLYEIWGRDYGIEESYLGPSQRGQPTNDWKACNQGVWPIPPSQLMGKSKKKQRILDLKHLYHRTSWRSRKGWCNWTGRVSATFFFGWTDVVGICTGYYWFLTSGLLKLFRMVPKGS